MRYTVEEVKRLSPETLTKVLNWTIKNHYMMNSFILGLYTNIDSFESVEEIEYWLDCFLQELATNDVDEIKGDL